MKKTIAALLIVLLAQSFSGLAQESKTMNDNGTWSYHFPKDNAESIQEWKDLRFGMFIHWGPISQRGKEIGWSRRNIIPVEEYDNLYKTFNPVKFDAEEWARTAVAAGMKYVVLTTKHHDGFCLWDSKQTSYTIMSTPFGRDVVKELSDACRKYGLKFCTYYSTCDWFHPDFPSPGYTKQVQPREVSDLDSYTTYLKRQVAELLLNYGPLEVLWFDVPQWFDEKRGQSVIDFVRGIQPDIIVNSRTGARGDFDNPEQRIGGFQKDRAWETCMTIGNQWAWKPGENIKSLEQCLQALVRTAGGDGNFLFNVGPDSQGVIEPAQAQRLKEMGDWLKTYGQAVYDTDGGPFKPSDWGVCTSRGNKIFLHILSWQGKDVNLNLPDIGIDILEGKILEGAKVNVTKTDGGHQLSFPASELKPYDTIVELTMSESVENVTPVDPVPQSKSYLKKVAASSEPDSNWCPKSSLTNGDWSGMSWVPADTDKTPWVEIDLGGQETISNVVLFESGESVTSFTIEKLNSDGKWKTVAKGTTIGARKEVKLPRSSTSKIRLTITGYKSTPALAEIMVF